MNNNAAKNPLDNHYLLVLKNLTDKAQTKALSALGSLARSLSLNNTLCLEITVSNVSYCNYSRTHND